MSGVVVGVGAIGALLYALGEHSKNAPSPGKRPPLDTGAPGANPMGVDGGVLNKVRRRAAHLLKSADPISWTMLELGAPGARVRVQVMSAPLSVGGRFVTVTPLESQWIADAHAGITLTPYVAWEMVRRAKVIVTPPPWHDGLTVEEMQAHVAGQVIAKLGRLNAPGELIGGGWKWWVHSKRLWEKSPPDVRSANFGLFPSGPAAGPVQGVGTVHNLLHIDWSQLHQHMGGMAQLETSSGWQMRPTGEVLVDATYASRLTGADGHIYAHRVVGEGVLPGLRHPYIRHWSKQPQPNA